MSDRLLSQDHSAIAQSPQRARRPVELFVESEAVVCWCESTAQSSGADVRGMRGILVVARLR